MHCYLIIFFNYRKIYVTNLKFYCSYFLLLIKNFTDFQGDDAISGINNEKPLPQKMYPVHGMPFIILSINIILTYLSITFIDR